MARKKVRTFIILLTLIIQLLFLCAIFVEKFQSSYTPFVIIFLCLLVLISYIKAPIHHRTNLYEHILIVVWIPAGALTCYFLNHGFHLGPVISAGIVGTTASFIPLL